MLILCSGLINVLLIQVIFQLYIKAKDSDPGPSSDDDLDDIIINRALQVNTGFTQMEVFTGILDRVSFRAQFRVMCQQDYYGAHCNTHCVDRNDDVNGHYTCNRDGSFQCLEGFENPTNNCRDSKLITLLYTNNDTMHAATAHDYLILNSVHLNSVVSKPPLANRFDTLLQVKLKC